MKTALVLLALAALPAAAQVFAPDGDALPAQAGDVAAAAKAAGEKAKKLTDALNTTLTAMRDGVAAGGQVMTSLDARKIDVVFATQAEPVKSGTVNGRAAILLSDALPAHPRVYAPLIAAEAVKGMFVDMPSCAEREYMRQATTARVFAELGGEFKALPKVDGDDAPAVKKAVAAWSTDSQTSLSRIAAEAKL